MRNTSERPTRVNSPRARGDRKLETRRGEEFDYQEDLRGRQDTFERQNFSSDRGQDLERERGYGNYSSYNSDRLNSDRSYRSDGSAANNYGNLNEPQRVGGPGMRNEDFHPRQNYNSNRTSFGGERIAQDYSPRQSYQGKGPKGYKRSDERIKEDVCEALERDHDIDASDIEVSVKDGEVTLSGTVTERQLKRRAEDCIERLSGVRDVVNQLRVQRGSDRSDSAKKGSSQANSLS